MVDHRHTLGESGRGYLCYVLKPPKIALISVSVTRSSAAIDGFQVHGRRRVFRCTTVDGFSGALPSTNFQVHGILSCGYEHMALTVGQWQLQYCTGPGHLAQLNIALRVWRTFKQFIPFSWCN